MITHDEKLELIEAYKKMVLNELNFTTDKNLINTLKTMLLHNNSIYVYLIMKEQELEEANKGIAKNVRMKE